MPTARPRHMITETDELAQAIDAAESVWPESRGERAELLRHIIARGVESLDMGREERRRKRLSALEKIAGKYRGMWPPDWHQQMVEEWPE